MILHKQNKKLFIHIPKCGGTSVRAGVGLNDLSPQEANTMHHFSFLSAKAFFDPRWSKRHTIEGYETCAMVRNTWDRIVSYITFERRPESVNPFKEKPFDYFVEAICNNDRRLASWVSSASICPIVGQTGMLINRQGVIDARVFIFPRVKDCIEYITGSPVSGEVWQNKTVRNRDKGWREYYSSRLLNTVADAFHEEIEAFNFTV